MMWLQILVRVLLRPTNQHFMFIRDVHPDESNPRTIECPYLNARSLNNKTSELQTLVTDVDLIAINETGSNVRLETVRLFHETLQSIVRADWTE